MTHVFIVSIQWLTFNPILFNKKSW